MKHRTKWLIGGLVLTAMAGEWALLRSFENDSPFASIECHATNAGSPLPAEAVRVFLYPADRPWQLIAEGHIDEALLVPPGRYDLRLLLDASADHASEWFRDIELAAGDSVIKQAEFSSGELSITSSDAGPSSASQIVVYVFAPDDHDQIITSIRPSTSAILVSGSYDLRAVLTRDSEETGVLWLEDVEVEAGARTTREVEFRRGELIVVAHNASEVLSTEAVTMMIHAAGDEQEEVLALGHAGVPISLAPGRYDVHLTFALSNDKASRWLRDLEIIENETLEREVVFSSGSLLVDAELVGGERLDEFDAYAYIYTAGEHREPVAYMPAGESAVVASGAYDVRVHFFRSHDRPDLWFRDIEVEAGKRAEWTATFASGRLLVRALDTAGQELIGDDVFVYVHDPHTPGVRSNPISVARSGEELTITAGEYNLRLEDTRGPDRTVWLRGVVVEPGRLHEQAVRMVAGGESARVPDERHR
jgi:hypothetical protein